MTPDKRMHTSIGPKGIKCNRKSKICLVESKLKLWLGQSQDPKYLPESLAGAESGAQVQGKESGCPGGEGCPFGALFFPQRMRSDSLNSRTESSAPERSDLG